MEVLEGVQKRRVAQQFLRVIPSLFEFLKGGLRRQGEERGGEGRRVLRVEIR